MSRIKNHYHDQLDQHDMEPEPDPGLEPLPFLRAPRCPFGLSAAWLEHEGIQLLCYYEYEPASTGAREPMSGMQLEPDYPATVAIVHAYTRDIDILPLMAFEIIDALEREILEGV